MLQDALSQRPANELNEQPLIEAKPSFALSDPATLAMHIEFLGEKKLNQLMQSFVVTMQDTWPDLQHQVRQGNRHQVLELAHKLAGCCDMLGFARASLQLRQLEQAAASTSFELLEQQLEQQIEQQLEQQIVSLQSVIAQSIEFAQAYCD